MVENERKDDNRGNSGGKSPKKLPALSAGRRVLLRTFGCQMNDSDSEVLAGLLLVKGYVLTEDIAQADIVLVNTCSVREHAENRALSFLGSLKEGARGKGQKLAISYQLSAVSCQLSDVRSQMSDDKGQGSPIGEADGARKIIGLIGCMAQNIGEEAVKKMPHINLVCGPANLDKIPAYLEEIIRTGKKIVDLQYRVRDENCYKALYRAKLTCAQVVISTGCSNYCSYCVVPYVRGELHLRPPDAILEQVRMNVDLGIKKITLLGQNVNDYKVGARGTGFVELLRMVSDVEGVGEVDFLTSHPKNITKDLFYLMAERVNIKKHLHLPFQSGSDRILKMMNRGYSRQDYLDITESYKDIVAGTLSTDVIVGFPTETDEDFAATKEMLEEVEFKGAYIFKYSPRQRTPAAKLKDDVPAEIKSQRHQVLLTLQKQISLRA